MKREPAQPDIICAGSPSPPEHMLLFISTKGVIQHGKKQIKQQEVYIEKETKTL